jgi:hypothetical protein
VETRVGIICGVEGLILLLIADLVFAVDQAQQIGSNLQGIIQRSSIAVFTISLSSSNRKLPELFSCPMVGNVGLYPGPNSFTGVFHRPCNTYWNRGASFAFT